MDWEEVERSTHGEASEIRELSTRGLITQTKGKVSCLRVVG